MGTFTAEIGAFVAGAKESAHGIVRIAIPMAGERLIERTPIDEGTARSNYNYSLETPDTHTTEATNIRTLNGIEDMPREAAGFVHFVTNSLPYMPPLERGSSTQAPNGMVGLTALEWPEIVAEATLRVTR